MNIADNFFSQKNYIEALTHFQTSLKLSLEIGYKTDVVGSIIGLSKTYYRLNDYEKGIELGNKGYALATELGKTEYIKDGAEILSFLYSTNGQYKQAYEYQVLFKNLSDSLLNKENHNS